MTTKRVYFFGNGEAEGRASMKNLLGGKGANLAEMTSLGVPVPPGFTITTETCTEFQKLGDLPEGLMAEVTSNLKRVEEIRGKQFGDLTNPLLFSVRSGARVSMPGMMDTVLNIGLNDQTVEALATASGDARFAWDSYRRLLQMYSDVVMGLDRQLTEKLIEERKEERGVALDTELSVDDWRDLTAQFKAVILDVLGKPFPQDPQEQLVGAIKAVFESWNIPRAKIYRRNNNISDDWGTAVNVQSMVFGNLGNNCATGVAFTRDPSDGTNIFFGEFLVNAQGEDVVAGIRTPQAINRSKDENPDLPTLEEIMPEAYGELLAIREKLENHYKDMQDLEFTIENGVLWMLQTRNGKRTIFSAIRIATDLVAQGMIDTRTAVARIPANELPKLFAPVLNGDAKIQAETDGLSLTRGLAASPGGAAGRLVLDPDKAQEWVANGDKVVLTRIETSPEDIGGMSVAEGILTARGGMTSHAAVVARGMGVPCVSGAGDLRIDYTARTVKVGAHLLHEGDLIAIDGFDGRVYKGEVEVMPSEILQVLSGKLKAEDSELYQRYEQIMTWSDEIKSLGVRTNADTPHDATVARQFGATGIGLCRTEHMFFGGDRILHVREMILADDEQGRRAALAQLLDFQREDFIGILGAMHDLPVTIRLLDPPLHEFLPHEAENQAEVAAEMGVSPEVIKQKVDALHEFNPMLGHRGCRLGISMPEITEMQARAIFEAAVQLTRDGVKVFPEVMVPLIGTAAELTHQKTVINTIAEQVFAEQGLRVDYLVGTMIEVPRAALTAAAVATEAQFFSFGTNDLTQMTFGYSRDDAGKFLKIYTEKDSTQWPKYLTAPILPNDPFEVLDREGVGQLVAMATQNGRKAREEAGLSRLKVGICGEHGGEPSSVEFCHLTGLDYVSCSPYRVPVARLAAAQAVLNN
ncbi:MAG: pyruvate, phosphate dikinase [Deltaproteobacteria bacterium]|nr:pyruvate, phosphate dikinase [Deltaproteobacteria bacterium]